MFTQETFKGFTLNSELMICFCLDEGLYRCEGAVDGCTYYFTTQTEENSERFVLFVQKEKGNTLNTSVNGL